MDFFQAQDDARKRSRIFVALFLAAVAAIIVLVYIHIHVLVYPGPNGPFDPAVFALVAAGVVLLVGGGSGWRIAALRQGGPTVARLVGGRQVPPDTSDVDERRLVNIVEEMAIASGVPAPAIFVLDDEEGINAFAAGYTIHDSAVAVTRGALRQLNRDELQGVIAHEFSHVLNGDMRLNIHLIGLLYGLLLLSVIGRGLLRAGAYGSTRRRKGGDIRVAVVGLALLVIGYIGVFFGQLIKAAVSRQREFLADAAAVQFTRNPQGIAGALKKIGGVARGSRVRHHRAAEVSHMLLASGTGSWLEGLFATHPPLEARIRRLDPTFDGRLAAGEAGAAALAGGRAPGASAMAGAGAGEPSVKVETDALVGSIGSVTAAHLDYAVRLLDGMPEPVRSAAHSPDDAPALIFALLFGASGGAVTEAQREAVRTFGGDELVARAEALVPPVRAEGVHARLPLLDVTLPALRELPPDRAAALGPAVRQVILHDNRIDPFEYALYRVLARQLAGPRERAAAAGTAIHSLLPLHAEVEVVLSALARAGSDGNDEAARVAFDAAAASMPYSMGRLRLRPAAEAGLGDVDRALGRLARGAPGVRRRVLQACAECIAYDRVAAPSEVEWFRAIAEALDCPVPPSLAVPTPAADSAAARPPTPA